VGHGTTSGVDHNAYYIEFHSGDTFMFKLTLNPSSVAVLPVYAGGQQVHQQPRSLHIKLKME
jgi:hypothetical protein